jgi:hypothetical protein
MIRNQFSSPMRLLGFSACLLLLVGCGTTYDLHLSLAEDYAKSLGDDHVFVHVIPVNPHDKDQLANLSLDDYWQYAGTKKVVPRERDTKIFELSADRPSAVLKKDDPIWKIWQQRGATELLVLSSRPMVEHPAPGEADPRRRFIPADVNKWDSADVTIALTANGLRVETGQKP